MDDKIDKKKSDDLLATARKRFAIGVAADSENRKNAVEDMQFRAGDQWDEQIKKQRALDGRPCLTINKIPGNVHQITNDQRKNRPAIRVSPVDDSADIETAEIYQGLIRSIERNSNADTAYDSAFDASVSGGRGFFRIVTDYCDPMSFDLEAKFKTIKNPHSVVVDPSYKEPDGSDIGWAFCYEDISKEDFKETYPDAKASSDTFDWPNDSNDWFSDETIRVAEYFVKELQEETLILLPDGSTVLQKELDEIPEENLIAIAQASNLKYSKEAIAKLKRRKTLVPVVKWYKINGDEILDETTFPSKWIPVIPVHGEELIVDGKRVFEGIIRHAKDPQRMYNYWATCETETIALAPKSPWVGVEGQFEGHEAKWNNAHLKNFAYMEYKATLLDDGTMAPPPQRQFGEPPVGAINQAKMFASDDIKATTSIYDASLGNRSNETSGKAITRRVQQTETSNFHFVDNLHKSIRHAGRILVDVIPNIYDAERVIRTLGEDDKEKIVFINKAFQDEKGKNKRYDLNVGKYDVYLDDGPSYNTKRQEAAESMISLVQSYPDLMKYIGDLMVKNFDWPQAQEIGGRLKKLVPPEVLGTDDETPIPPEVKAQMDQMNQMVEQLTTKLNETQDQLEGKMIEIESKERIEMAKIEKDLEISKATLEAKNNATPEMLAGMKMALIELGQRLDMLHFNSPINEDEISENLEKEISQINNNNPTGGMAPGSTDQDASMQETLNAN